MLRYGGEVAVEWGLSQRLPFLAPVRVNPPAVLPIGINDVSAHAVLNFHEDNNLAKTLIQAAVDHVDGFRGILGRCLINQTWRLDLPGWPATGTIRLPFPDVSSVELKYSDSDNVEQTLSATEYDKVEDARGAVVLLNGTFSAPVVYDDRADAVRVTFVAGYGTTAAEVPASIRLALMEIVAAWYASREGTGNIPESADAKLRPHRWNSY